jgi:hypothetical protein
MISNDKGALMRARSSVSQGSFMELCRNFMESGNFVREFHRTLQRAASFADSCVLQYMDAHELSKDFSLLGRYVGMNVHKCADIAFM